MTEQHRADHTCQIRGRKRAECEQGTDQRHKARKEHLIEHERRGGREHEQVVPFDRRANDARDGNSLHAVLDLIRFEGTVNGVGMIHGILHGKLSARAGSCG
jgi:hypothetical protein